MKRRSALKSISLGLGYTMTAAGMTMFVSSCKQDGSVTALASEWTPAFMNKTQAGVVENILDALLPTTASSPGFKAVNAIQMFDNTIKKLWKKEDQDDFNLGLAQLSARFKKDHGVELDRIEATHIDAFMKAHMGEVPKKEKDRRGDIVWGDRSSLKPEQMDDFYFYKLVHNLRNLGIGTYFSNEIIATEHLGYDPIPGGYDGCTDYTADQNSWYL